MPPLDRKKTKAGLAKYSGREELTCERWMTPAVYTVKPLDSVAHARALLEKHRIHQLPVVKGGALVGIVTDRDLRDAVDAVTSSAKLAGMGEAAPQTGKEIRVEAVMTENVITLNRDSSLLEAAEIMRRERIGAVPIVDGQTLAGIVTRSDILKAFVTLENDRKAHAQPPTLPKRDGRHTESGR